MLSRRLLPGFRWCHGVGPAAGRLPVHGTVIRTDVPVAVEIEGDAGPNGRY